MNGADRESGRPEPTTRTRAPGRCDRARTTAVGSDLTLPEVGRTAPDDLTGQSADRAQDVPTNQGRLRCLLRANAAVVGDLSLPVVLRRIVDAARELVMARHGALGVIGSDGRLAQSSIPAWIRTWSIGSVPERIPSRPASRTTVHR